MKNISTKGPDRTNIGGRIGALPISLDWIVGARFINPDDLPSHYLDKLPVGPCADNGLSIP